MLFRRVSLQQHNWHLAIMYTVSVLYQITVIIAQVYRNLYVDALTYMIIFAFILSSLYSDLRLMGALLPICPLLNAKILTFVTRSLVVLYLIFAVDKILVTTYYTWQIDAALTISSVSAFHLGQRMHLCLWRLLLRQSCYIPFTACTSTPLRENSLQTIQR